MNDDENCRCNIPCAHQGDVHDCDRCKKAVGFSCAPICQECAEHGYDTCRHGHTHCDGFCDPNVRPV